MFSIIDCSPTATLEEVRNILTHLNINKPEFLDLLTVRQVLKKLSLFLCFVPEDLPDALIINQTCERVVSMLKECVKHEDNAPVKAAPQLASAVQQSPVHASHVTHHAPSHHAAAKDVDKAWEILQNKSKIKPECVDQLSALLEELGIDSGESLNDVDQTDYENIATMLKKAGANGFMKALGLPLH